MKILTSGNAWIFLLILFLATFLRCYHFEDWLRVNEDQVRDVRVVDRMLSGKQFPLLGPKVGGTGFNLPPGFYYIEFLSASIFHKSFANLAYPIAFFSILSVGLFFYLNREIFGSNIALILTFFYAISAFFIKYSRFAWNPNLLPFFILLALVAFYQLNHSFSEKKRVFWSVVAGLAVGFGMQLHATSLFILPALSVFSFFYFYFQKKFHFFSLAIILTIVFLANSPALVYDFQSGWENYQAFVKGFNKKTKSKSGLPERIGKALACSVQMNLVSVSGITMGDDCDIVSKKNRQSRRFWPSIIFGGLFFFGGLYFLLKKFLQERDGAKKFLLASGFFYFGIFFILLIPLEEDVFQRFFVGLVFLPFFILGAWLTFLFSLRKQKIILFLVLPVLIVFSFYNLFIFKKMYLDEDDGGKYFGGTKLGQVRAVADFLEKDIQKNQVVDGRYFIPNFGGERVVEYLLKRINADHDIHYQTSLKKFLKQADEKTVVYVVKDLAKKKEIQENFSGFSVVEKKQIGTYYMIFKLKKP